MTGCYLKKAWDEEGLVKEDYIEVTIKKIKTG